MNALTPYGHQSAIAEALGKKICVSREKFNTLKCLDDPKLTKMLTLDPAETNIHVLPMGQFNYKVTRPSLSLSLVKRPANPFLTTGLAQLLGQIPRLFPSNR